jgi:hypothetical protein
MEQANANLRSRNRESNRAAKAAAARIAELEEQVSRLEQQVAARGASARSGRKAQPPESRRGRRVRDIDPGDAVPPGVAVLEPAPLDQDAETARENLEDHLGGK